MSDSLSALCLRCGLCCDGTLFTQVPLAAGEVVRLPVLVREDGRAALRQPCAALEGRCCTIYEERPASCRRFRCMLQTALAETEVSLAEALAVVDEAHALLAAVAPPPGPGAAVQRVRQLAQAQPERAEARRLLHLLERHFRGSLAG